MIFKIKCTLVLFVCVSMSGTISAQQEATTAHWQFHSINNVGLLEGEAASVRLSALGIVFIHAPKPLPHTGLAEVL